MPYQQVATSPNMDKLIHYLQKSLWHNVSSNFCGFVRKEYEANLEKLEEDEEVYKNLQLMLEFSEMGRFSEARNMIDPAYKEYQEMMNKLTDLKLMKQNTRRSAVGKPVQFSDNFQRRETYTPDRRDITTPQKRNVYTPNQRQTEPQGNSEYQRQVPSRGNPEYQRQATPHGNTDYGTPRRHHEVSDRSPGTPQYASAQDQTSYDPHRENYDSLRLKSPEKPTNSHLQEHQNKYDMQRNTSPGVEHESRPNSQRQDRRTPPTSALQTTAGQMSSSKALWGLDYGDKPSEKVSYSTYKNDFPSYTVDSRGRTDKETYRQNFGSLAERDMYRGGDDSYHHEEQRRSDQHSRQHSRPSETPDFDSRPSELARRFKELHMNEWTDAYDEICKDFGSEKTVRHLLWMVTEASLIANDVAERQLRDLEKQTFGVMTHSGNDHEAWLIAIDVAYKQLKDLEKAALGLMATPGDEHHGGYIPRNLGDTMPASKGFLLKYRKQTAMLSIPYVKEECRDKISRTLIESSGFPKQHLSDASRLTAYIYKCAELVWLMCVQDPPIVLEYINKETEGARFNHEHYQVYTKAGTTYDFGVWPMLRIGKKGQILAKGIAQGI